MDDNRESLLTTLRSRRKLYLWFYFIQIAAWLTVVVIYQVEYAQPAPAIKRAIDTAVTISFISPGVFVSTMFLVDVIVDSVKKGWGLMGLLFTPKSAKEILQERGEKIGEERAKADAAAWYAEMQQAIKEGREFDEPPPFLDDDDDAAQKQ